MFMGRASMLERCAAIEKIKLPINQVSYETVIGMNKIYN